MYDDYKCKFGKANLTESSTHTHNTKNNSSSCSIILRHMQTMNTIVTKKHQLNSSSFPYGASGLLSAAAVV